MWERFNNRENLLFREADFAEPGESELFQELWTLREPAARALVGRLLLVTEQPLDQVPLLEEIVDGRQVRPLTALQEHQVAALLVTGRRVASAVAAGATSTPIGMATSADVGAVSEAPGPLEPVSGSSDGATRPATDDPTKERTDHRASQRQVARVEPMVTGGSLGI